MHQMRAQNRGSNGLFNPNTSYLPIATGINGRIKPAIVRTTGMLATSKVRRLDLPCGIDFQSGRIGIEEHASRDALGLQHHAANRNFLVLCRISKDTADDSVGGVHLELNGNARSGRKGEVTLRVEPADFRW